MHPDLEGEGYFAGLSAGSIIQVRWIGTLNTPYLSSYSPWMELGESGSVALL